MTIIESGDGNHGPGAEEVPRGGDIVTGFVPEVGQSEQAEMGEKDGGEDEGIEQPERQSCRRGARSSRRG